MCNLFNQTTAVEAMQGLFRGVENRARNIETGASNRTAWRLSLCATVKGMRCATTLGAGFRAADRTPTRQEE